MGLLQSLAETRPSSLGVRLLELVDRRMAEPVKVAFAPSVYSAYSPISSAVRVVVTPNDFQHLHFPENFTKKELRRRAILYDRAMAKADLVIAGSRQTLGDVDRFYPDKAHLARVLPFPAPADLRQPTPEESGQAKGVLGPVSEPIVLYPAQLWPHKNHLVLLRAVLELQKHWSLPVKLVLTGEGPCGDRIRAAAESMGLRRSVVMCGNVSRGHLFALFKSADLVVVPSLFEQASYPLMEAGWFDTAVLASDIPSLREELQRFPHALLPPSEPGAWAEAIYRACTNGDQRKNLTEAARSVYSRHDPAKATRGFWDAVTELANRA